MRPSAVFALFTLLPLTGCAMVPPQPISNPTFIPANDQAAIWENAVDVLHVYQFPVERENRLDGIIESDYKVGAGLIEPWHRDAITMGDRFAGFTAVDPTPSQSHNDPRSRRPIWSKSRS